MEKALSNKGIWGIAALLIVAAFILAALSPAVHDYLFYEEDWSAILYGNKRSLDEWNIPINYGPVFYFMALIYAVHPKIPQLFMVVCWAACSCYMLRLFLRHQYKTSTLLIVFCLLFLNPLLWFYIIYYGSIDALLCFLTLFGLVFYEQKKYAVSAVFIALGILLKLFPVFIVPFLVFRNRKVNLPFFSTLIIVLLVVSGITYLVFDVDAVSNFLFQAKRPSTTLSVFRFLRGDFSPLHLISKTPNLDFISIYLSLGSLLILFFIHLKYNFAPLISAVLSLILILTFHTVGNHQYYITPMFLLLFFIHKESLAKPGFEIKTTHYMIFPIFISAVPLLEFIIRRFMPQLRFDYDNLIGIVAFAFSIQIVYLMFKAGFRSPLK